MGKKTLRGVLALVLATTAAGCVHTGFTRTSPLELPPRPGNCYLDLILEGLPPAPYVVLGRVSTDSTAPGLWAIGESEEVAVSRMREEACRVGAHPSDRVVRVGTPDLRCAFRGAGSARACPRRGPG